MTAQDALTEIAAIASRRMFRDVTDMSNCEVIIERARIAQRSDLRAFKALQIAEDRRRAATDRMADIAKLFTASQRAA
jgi:hypothetical protein